MNQTNPQTLPHFYQPIGAVFMITWRLHGSLPEAVAFKIKAKRELAISKIPLSAPDYNTQLYMAYREESMALEDYLDTTTHGPFWLREPEVARIVIEHLRKYDGQYYHLLAYSIMANHIHVLMDFGVQSNIPVVHSANLKDYVHVSKAMQLIKGASARFCNLQLNRSGHFWSRDYYDRFIRSEKHFNAAKNYILMNPVKAKLCEDWQQHPFTWSMER